MVGFGMKVAVVGGGLAGLSAALDLADAGCDVTLYEARPTLGGAVQTLPAREGDPEPPPDNGQHIALGCFTEYLRFLDRIGSAGAVRRAPLALPVIDERGVASSVRRSPASLLRYRHLAPGERLAAIRALLALRKLDPREVDGATFGEVLRRLGQSQLAIERFWDVFIRPALNLPADEACAVLGTFTVQTGLLASRSDSDLVIPIAPLGAMHGDAARRAVEEAGGIVREDTRVTALDELDADAVVIAAPPAESARLLGEEPPQLADSPIVSVHLLFDRPLLRAPLAALLGSDAHWVFDRGRLTGNLPEGGGQYLTVVSSGVPELMEIRGRDLVERIASQLVERLGRASLLWSRVSREPQATIAATPGQAHRRLPAGTSHPNVVRAGAWTQTGWPATMESAVRSGRTAASMLGAEVTWAEARYAS